MHCNNLDMLYIICIIVNIDAPTIPTRRVSSIKMSNPPIASALVLLLLLAAQSIFVLWSTLAALYYAVSVHSKEDPPASISRHPPSQREPAFKSTKYLIIWRTGLSLIKSVHWYLQHLRQVLKGQTVNKAWIFSHQRQFKLEVTFPENEFSITRKSTVFGSIFPSARQARAGPPSPLTEKVIVMDTGFGTTFLMFQ